MTVVPVGNNEQLAIEERAHGLALYKAAAGARIELQFTVKTVHTNPTVSLGPFHITADLYASRIRNSDERMVGQLTSTHLVTPSANGGALTMHGLIGGEELRAIEAIRDAQSLVLRLKLALFTTAAGRLDRYDCDEYLDVHHGVWNTEIEKVDAASFVEVLVPISPIKALADANRLVRAGRELIREGDDAKHIDGALLSARKALEPVRKKLRTIAVAKSAAGIESRQHTQEQREAVLIEALFAYVSGAMHNDPVTKDFEYSRTNAITALAATPGLIRRVGETI